MNLFVSCVCMLGLCFFVFVTCFSVYIQVGALIASEAYVLKYPYDVWVCMYVCMHARSWVNIYTCVCVYMYIYIDVSIDLKIYRYRSIHVCLYRANPNPNPNPVSDHIQVGALIALGGVRAQVPLRRL